MKNASCHAVWCCSRRCHSWWQRLRSRGSSVVVGGGAIHAGAVHSVEVMVYQYDKHFEYGCWMTSIPTMSHIVTFLGYSEFPNWLPWQPIQILQYPKSIQQNLKMWVMVGILVIQQQYQEVYHIDIPLPPHCDAMLGVPMEGELAKTLDSVSFSREEAKELVIGKVLG